MCTLHGDFVRISYGLESSGLLYAFVRVNISYSDPCLGFLAVLGDMLARAHIYTDWRVDIWRIMRYIEIGVAFCRV